MYRRQVQPLVRALAGVGGAGPMRVQRLLSLSSSARESLDGNCPTLVDDDFVITRNMDPCSKGYGSVGVHVKPFRHQ